VRGPNGRGGPIVVVQCESFFDARRLSPLVPRTLLPGFAECCGSAAMFGRLEVAGWGANTMRAEFAVLTGIPESAIGYDRFNPYHALARAPLASHVWRLREAGYRTICLHPYSRRFFRRDLVMPALGFERFLCRRALGGSRVPPYQADPELAGHVLRRLDAEGPRCFVFVITMDNHGPWLGRRDKTEPTGGDWLDAAVPQRAELLRYLDGLRRSDEMLQILMAGLAERHPDATLAFYGDHLPSLPRAFNHFGFTAPHSDYVIWPGREDPPLHTDLPAHLLGDELLSVAFGNSAEPGIARRLAGR
jgi:phosphoglycerol transferase MdoB-like AlkP superfamily enzyme